MNTCDTCRWWDEYEKETKCGVCSGEHTKAWEVVHFYQVDGIVYDDWFKIPIESKKYAKVVKTISRATSPNAAFVDEYHCERAVFVTGPKFGCIHWEANP